jgi:hypothetical protein
LKELHTYWILISEYPVKLRAQLNTLHLVRFTDVVGSGLTDDALINGFMKFPEIRKIMNRISNATCCCFIQFQSRRPRRRI